MSDRPTPETDSLYKKDHRPNLLAHSRKLERQRDEAQDAALEMEFRLKQAERRNVEHEDDYLAVWRAIKRPNETVLEACKRILRQRDELMEALYTIDERFIDGYDTYDDWKFMGETARAAIAAVKGATT
jgi:hypothetical protein